MPRWQRPLRYALMASALLTLSCEQACKVANNVGQFIDSISDGAPCEVNAECLGQYCLKEDIGFPGGYCTSLNCEEDGCSGLSSECFRAEIEGQQTTSCYELCDFDGTCERADEGYVCVTLDDTAVCLPPGVTSAPEQGTTGSSCSQDLQCNGDNNICLTNFFGGYCSQTDCGSNSDCIGGNACLSTNPDDADAATACFLSCETDDDCRFQYACQEYDGQMVCLEGERTETKNPDGANDGAECNSQLQCKGGTCIRESEGEGEGEVSFPGGYCTTRDCETAEDCNGGVCVTRARSTTCLAACESNDDCRDGYECVDTADGTDKVCDTVVEQVTPDPADAESPFTVECSSAKTHSFTVPDGAEGFFVGPFTTDGQKITPKTLTYPGGQTLDIPTEYKFMAINPELLGGMAPIMFPGSDQQQFRNVFGGGEWSMTVETSSSNICWHVVPKQQLGTTLNINFYLVGVPGLNASQAASDTDMDQVMQVVRTIYGKMDITATVANFIDASDAVADQYSIIRDFNDIYNLVATSTVPGSTVEDALSVNVFLINDFNISEAPGVLGVSSGIPGMAGLHGNSSAGLVFSSASLGENNKQLGQTMAHEIGHFLGLRHTTEHNFLGHDPITDTPECLNPNLAGFCPDSDNFMFAFSLGSDQLLVTTGQEYVVRRNPLVQ